MKGRLFTIMLLIFLGKSLMAQKSQQDLAFEREMEQAVDLMAIEEYDSADSHLRHVIQNMKVLPTNISFYFGKNSLYLGRYKQSINWLTKYIELAGTSGRFFDEASELLDQANENYREERQQEIVDMVEELHDIKEVKCTESQMVICPVCRGLGIVIRERKFGSEYLPCPFSNDQGRLTCADYNLLLEGKLKPKN